MYFYYLENYLKRENSKIINKQINILFNILVKKIYFKVFGSQINK